MFERPHHQRIGQVLQALDGALLRAHRCWFGGGTAIALRHGEYRESVDMDFLVSDIASYRSLRQLLTGPQGVGALAREGAPAWAPAREVRADQYGIRTMLRVERTLIKFEIVLEGRMPLAAPGRRDEVCGIATLTPLDLVTSKLLANADRWADDGVFNRDLIDLAMMKPALPLLRRATAKAEQAYGAAILRDLGKAVERLKHREDWLDRCMLALGMQAPRALVWQRLRALERLLDE